MLAKFHIHLYSSFVVSAPAPRKQTCIPTQKVLFYVPSCALPTKWRSAQGRNLNMDYIHLQQEVDKKNGAYLRLIKTNDLA